jgi:hypothetical protein
MNPMGRDGDPEFDDWLGRELRHRLDPVRGSRPHPSQARYRTASHTWGARLMAIKSSIAAAFGAKALVGGAVVAMAAGAAAGTATTGSANPVNWGQHIVQVVEGCKHDVRSGHASGNVGECVSDVAQTHGQQERAQHSEAAGTSPSPKAGQRVGQGGTAPAGSEAANHARATAPPSPGAGRSDGRGRSQPAATPSPHD